MRRKTKVLELLEKGPATTGDIRQACDCKNGAQAYGTLNWLVECGAIARRQVPRDHSKGGKATTTLWSLVGAK